MFSTRVTIVEMLDRLAPFDEPEVSAASVSRRQRGGRRTPAGSAACTPRPAERGGHRRCGFPALPPTRDVTHVTDTPSLFSPATRKDSDNERVSSVTYRHHGRGEPWSTGIMSALTITVRSLGSRLCVMGQSQIRAKDRGHLRMPGEQATAIAVVQIRLLGRFAVLRDSAEIPLRAFGGRLPQQLLRLLALRRGALIPKDVIAEALWARRPPADARGNIEVLVSRIRRALGDPALIRTGSGGYSLTGGRECWVDAEAFLAAARDGRGLLADRPAEALASFRGALEMWHGEPLAEDTYADWAQQDRRCLTLALLDALEGAAAAALDGG